MGHLLFQGISYVVVLVIAFLVIVIVMKQNGSHCLDLALTSYFLKGLLEILSTRMWTEKDQLSNWCHQSQNFISRSETDAARWQYNNISVLLREDRENPHNGFQLLMKGGRYPLTRKKKILKN